MTTPATASPAQSPSASRLSMPSPGVTLFSALALIALGGILLGSAEDSSEPGGLGPYAMVGYVLNGVGALLTLATAFAVGARWGMKRPGAHAEAGVSER